MFAFTDNSGYNESEQEFMYRIYHEFHRLMFATVGKYLANPLAQEEVVQEGLARLTNVVHILQPMNPYALVSYIVSTVRNVAINYLRDHGVQDARLISLDDFPVKFAADGLSLDELMILSEAKAQLKKIWPMLPEGDRILLEGKYFLGLDDTRLAALMHCQAASIRMKLTRARRNALKLLLKEEEGATNP